MTELGVFYSFACVCLCCVFKREKNIHNKEMFLTHSWSLTAAMVILDALITRHPPSAVHPLLQRLDDFSYLKRPGSSRHSYQRSGSTFATKDLSPLGPPCSLTTVLPIHPPRPSSAVMARSPPSSFPRIWHQRYSCWTRGSSRMWKWTITRSWWGWFSTSLTSACQTHWSRPTCAVSSTSSTQPGATSLQLPSKTAGRTHWATPSRHRCMTLLRTTTTTSWDSQRFTSPKLNSACRKWWTSCRSTPWWQTGPWPTWRNQSPAPWAWTTSSRTPLGTMWATRMTSILQTPCQPCQPLTAPPPAPQQ